jgi:hypothetical protein
LQRASASNEEFLFPGSVQTRIKSGAETVGCFLFNKKVIINTGKNTGAKTGKAPLKFFKNRRCFVTDYSHK